MIRALIPIAALMALTACNSGDRAPDAGGPTVQASDAICRPTPKGRRMTGCYLTLTSSADDRLTGVESPSASRIEIHESRMESNMMMMNEMRGGLPLPAGEPVVLAPGGHHLMVMGIEKPLVAGDSVVLNLTFLTAPPIEVTATVGQPATSEYAPAPAADPAAAH